MVLHCPVGCTMHVLWSCGPVKGLQVFLKCIVRSFCRAMCQRDEASPSAALSHTEPQRAPLALACVLSVGDNRWRYCLLSLTVRRLIRYDPCACSMYYTLKYVSLGVI